MIGVIKSAIPEVRAAGRGTGIERCFPEPGEHVIDQSGIINIDHCDTR
jgi:hypothetical protein